MSNDMPLVAVPTDVRDFDNYLWHGVPQPYLEAAISAAEVTPLGVPSFGADRINLKRVLDVVDGVMITGAKSNVHPPCTVRRPRRTTGLTIRAVMPHPFR